VARLSELSPRWIHPDVFVFKCPHCMQWWIPCKRIEMSSKAQYDLYEKEFGEDWNSLVIPVKESFSWKISGDEFDSMTVSPSIDASHSGHWHGNIANGEITG
jgi:hypothetical protein